ncbi:response regulator [Brunnivagina elsteri]|uniref:Two-component system response regulator n=1 Tax=Brunnivagina elsteri CCALA 953 TaxID=987040 RepID=A0A2A2TFU3_9CYAN|nr:response regulator [Calothrix elsteri]PAX52546.1 two-component system response regulator [Calothrix elsteri CCALA 953]
MNIFGTFTRLRPLSLLRHLSTCHDSTCLHVLNNSVSWLIYLEQGKIIYATHSVEPFDRLERHLRRLSHQLPALSSDIRVQLRLMFEVDTLNQSNLPEQPPEYQAICWLVSQRHINPTQAAILIQEMVKEVLESFLLIGEGNYKLINIVNKLPVICRIDTEKILEMCQEQLLGWQSLAPHISSPYQRPYLRVQTAANQQRFSEIHQNLTAWMRGFSLRHLAVIVNQDEVKIARSLCQYILNGEVVLHEPDPPFDRLPKTFKEFANNGKDISDGVESEFIRTVATSPVASSAVALRGNGVGLVEGYVGVNTGLPLTQVSYRQPETIEPPKQQTQIEVVKTPPPREYGISSDRKTHKIVSVDDSPTVLREISRFLEQENFSVVTINDPVKAVMSIIRNKPDLILLDLNMDGIDGYELCKIIRNNSMFKKTPIIMVTGNKGLIDKVKARLVGASGYLTKPFTQADLLKIVFMHLT